MQAESASVDLKKLASELSQPGMPSQAAIGAAAGVSQSTVSRAISGLIGDSRGAMLLWEYVKSRPSAPAARVVEANRPSAKSRRASKPKRHDQKLKQVALDRLKAYLDDEFDPELVIEQIGVLRRAQRVNVRGRKAAALNY